MSILLYASDRSNASEPVVGALLDILVVHGIWPCGSMASLKEALRLGGGRFSLAVLVAATAEELSEIISLQPLLINLRLILIVPGDDLRQVELGHRLRPRFLTTIDDLAHLAEITKKMLEQNAA